MAIVPIYRLRADSPDKEKDRRYRFSRQPTPDPNPHPGHPDEDAETRWIVEGVAFYAWSDRVYDGETSEKLRPVYEFHRCVGRRHRYYYSLDERGPRGKGWEKRPYVAFWAHAEDVEDGAPGVYRYEQIGNDEKGLACQRIGGVECFGEPAHARVHGPLEDRHRELGASFAEFGGWSEGLRIGQVLDLALPVEGGSRSP